MFTESVYTRITTHNLIPPDSTVIVGLSGGADSVCLLHILHTLQHRLSIRLVAAHVDHQWRAESSADALWCKNFCKQLSIPFESTTLSNISIPRKHNGSDEEYARNGRRTFFESLAAHHNASSIALAHHQQDQMETFFIRLLRGSGIEGLQGMHMRAGLYVRPLLLVSKHDIISYLTHHGISYVEDSTNQSLEYLRNRIRHTVIPSLYACDERFEKKFLSTITHLQQADEFINEVIDSLYAQITDGQGCAINYTRLISQHPFAQHKLLMRWLKQHGVPFTPSEHFFKEIIKYLSHATASSHKIHARWSISKEGEWATIVRSS